MKTLKKEDKEKIAKAAYDLDDTQQEPEDEREDATVAATKIAKEYDFNPDMTRLFIRSYNTGVNNRNFKTGNTIKEKTAVSPIVNPEHVVEEIFGDLESVKSSKVDLVDELFDMARVDYVEKQTKDSLQEAFNVLDKAASECEENDSDSDDSDEDKSEEDYDLLEDINLDGGFLSDIEPEDVDGMRIEISAPADVDISELLEHVDDLVGMDMSEMFDEIAEITKELGEKDVITSNSITDLDSTLEQDVENIKECGVDFMDFCERVMVKFADHPHLETYLGFLSDSFDGSYKQASVKDKVYITDFSKEPYSSVGATLDKIEEVEKLADEISIKGNECLNKAVQFINYVGDGIPSKIVKNATLRLLSLDNFMVKGAGDLFETTPEGKTEKEKRKEEIVKTVEKGISDFEQGMRNFADKPYRRFLSLTDPMEAGKGKYPADLLKIFDAAHQIEVNQVKARHLLYQLLQDPAMSIYDPREVAQNFNTLIALQPDLLRVPPVLKMQIAAMMDTSQVAPQLVMDTEKLMQGLDKDTDKDTGTA